MPARPTPPRTDIETTRALNAANRCGHARWRRTSGHITTYAGRAIYYAQPRHPYGRSTHATGYLTHLAVHLYIAWRHGAVVGQLVTWRCGGSTRLFTLLPEPTSPLCPVCVAYACGPSRLLITAGVA